MPRPRRAARVRRREYADSFRVCAKLVCGSDFACFDPDLGPAEHTLPPGPEREALQALWAEDWEAIGDDVLDAFVFGGEAARRIAAGVVYEAQPGRRPWSWWCFEAKEPPRGLEEEDDWRASAFSLLSGRYGLRPGADVEKSADYLARRKLLLPGERALLSER